MAVLIATGVAVPSVAAAPSPGSVCSKIGKTQLVSNKRFTCIKSGKKLVWSKPVSVKITPPSPKATPAPTKPTLDSLDANSVYNSSRGEVAQWVKTNSANKVQINYFVGASVSQSTIGLVKPDLLSAANLWSPVFSSGEEVNVIWYVHSDLDWAASKYIELTGNPIEWSTINGNCSVNYCGNATATHGRTGKYVFEQGMTLDLNQWNRPTAAHEYTHLAQERVSNSKSYLMPLWLREGSAQFYGEAIGLAQIDSYKSIRQGLHNQYISDIKNLVSDNFQGQSVKQVLLSGSEESTRKLMKLIEFDGGSSEKTALAYLLGSYASEVLVSVFGHTKMVDLYKSFAQSNDWEANFASVYGFSTSAFYSKLAPYFQKMASELRN